MQRTHIVCLVALTICALLACTGSQIAMQIVDAPIYVCPSATPRATDTPAPTQQQPPVYQPPSGWSTLTPVPGCIWRGYGCATHTPQPGGMYRTPGYSLPGATSTPRPTTTPYPTPTGFVLRPPQPFYMGDAIYAGGIRSLPNVRLRLLDVQVTAATSSVLGQPRSLVRWTLELRNVGVQAYETFPAYMSYVGQVNTASGELVGVWGVSQEAAVEVGISPLYEAVSLAAGETRRFDLAAYVPAGTPTRFVYTLDPVTTRTETLGTALPGLNPVEWVNQPNPFCSGDIRDPDQGGVLPTPID